MRRIGLLILLQVLLITGCSQLRDQFVSPEARVAGFQLVELGLFSGTAEVLLEVDNPNAYKLVADGLKYQVWLGGYSIADTQSERRIELPANETARVEIPLEFSYQGLYSAVQMMLETGEIGYRVEGAVSTHFIELPFSRSGQLRLRESSEGRSSPSI